MNRTLALMALSAAMTFVCANDIEAADTPGQFKKAPSSWKWISDREVIFSYDGTYTDSLAFSFNARSGKVTEGTSAPEKYSEFPLRPEGAVNLTYSPDSTKLAFTRDNDLYVIDIATGKEARLTFDGTDLILNGYSSWVYYEEILGRPTRYKAFWWSPDSRKIGFYRFDNTQVPLFPIYSPFGQDGKLNNTRYPKAGERNPEVKIGIVDISDMFNSESPSGTAGNESGTAVSVDAPEIVWADFDPKEDQYFGIPFWGADSREFYIARMPRIQNTLDLYAVSAADGSRRHVYHEQYKTWIDWINAVYFTDNGLYMARRFETGWEQIYFLSYDGKTFTRLTDGENWGINILRVDEKRGELFFTARRDSRVRETLYRVSLGKGFPQSVKKTVSGTADTDVPGTGNTSRAGYAVETMTDPAYNISGVKFSDDGKYFVASYSNYTTPVKVAVFDTGRKVPVLTDLYADGYPVFPVQDNMPQVCPAAPVQVSVCRHEVVADMAYEGYSPDDYALAQLIWLEMEDGQSVPAAIVYPKDFDPQKKYPVHMDIYGGPDTPMVRDRWSTPSGNNQWWSDHGIIEITADCRASGHNGRSGTDLIYRNLTEVPVRDFIAWARYLQSLPYVQADKIGVEGFSFGGTMTSMLLFRAPEQFHYGIAGGGVYDWRLYDSHYTERYMETPQTNQDGYKAACALEYAGRYPVTYSGKADADTECPDSCQPGLEPESSASRIEPVMLKLTHGTGDDNVHFQNTLQLIDALQKGCKKFDFMIYPDGMHGYGGYQQAHFTAANREFWLKYLKGE